MKITKTQNSRLANTDFNKLEFGKTFSDHMLMCKFQDGQWQEAEILPINHYLLLQEHMFFIMDKPFLKE